MRYIIYGAGAIGGGLGGMLHLAGLESVLICRGAQLQAVREHGLTIHLPDRTLKSTVSAVSHPRELTFRDDDVVILTMKAQDTEGALLDLEASGGGALPIICCQNGVDNERVASRRFARVYGMLVAYPANYTEAGTVVLFGAPTAGVLDCGGYPSGTDALIEQVAADISTAGFSSRALPGIMPLKYAKLLANLPNGLTALTSAPRTDPEVRRLVKALTEEGMRCFDAAGIEYTPRDEYEEEIRTRYKSSDVPGHERAGTSTWQSLARGAPSVEVDYLNGEIVLLGRLHGVPTPYNAAIRRLTQQMVYNREPIRHYSIEQLLAELEPSPAPA